MYIMHEFVATLLYRKPSAFADVRGSEKYPDLSCTVYFYEINGGTLVSVNAAGLPEADEPCRTTILGFHIHEGESCTGNDKDPFADTKGHLNPEKCEHPNHMGDMPPLFGNHGSALSIFFTDRFRIRDIIGKTVVIHGMPDDFKSQPSGDSGMKIACGTVIEADSINNMGKINNMSRMN